QIAAQLSNRIFLDFRHFDRLHQYSPLLLDRVVNDRSDVVPARQHVQITDDLELSVVKASRECAVAIGLFRKPASRLVSHFDHMMEITADAFFLHRWHVDCRHQSDQITLLKSQLWPQNLALGFELLMGSGRQPLLDRKNDLPLILAGNDALTMQSG